MDWEAIFEKPILIIIFLEIMHEMKSQLLEQAILIIINPSNG